MVLAFTKQGFETLMYCDSWLIQTLDWLLSVAYQNLILFNLMKSHHAISISSLGGQGVDSRTIILHLSQDNVHQVLAKVHHALFSWNMS